MLPLNRLAIDSTLQWGELPAVPSTLEVFSMRSIGYVSGTVPDSVGAVDNLKSMWMRGLQRLSGTIPEFCGHIELGYWLTTSIEIVGGALKDVPHPDHASAACVRWRPLLDVRGPGQRGLRTYGARRHDQ